MKLLGIDVGEKRIGIAVTDEEGIVARPLLTLPATESFMENLGKVIASEKPVKIIFGIPRHMSGEEANAAQSIRKFAKGVQHEFKTEIDFQDESLSSVEAEKRLFERGFDREKIKEMVDAEAAAVILEDYLREQAPN